jgi:hypothetical protein
MLAQCHQRNQQKLSAYLADGRTSTSTQDAQRKEGECHTDECARNKNLDLPSRAETGMQSLLHKGEEGPHDKQDHPPKPSSTIPLHEQARTETAEESQEERGEQRHALCVKTE